MISGNMGQKYVGANTDAASRDEVIRYLAFMALKCSSLDLTDLMAGAKSDQRDYLLTPPSAVSNDAEAVVEISVWSIQLSAFSLSILLQGEQNIKRDYICILSTLGWLGIVLRRSRRFFVWFSPDRKAISFLCMSDNGFFESCGAVPDTPGCPDWPENGAYCPVVVT